METLKNCLLSVVRNSPYPEAVSSDRYVVIHYAVVTLAVRNTDFHNTVRGPIKSYTGLIYIAFKSRLFLIVCWGH